MLNHCYIQALLILRQELLGLSVLHNAANHRSDTRKRYRQQKSLNTSEHVPYVILDLIVPNNCARSFAFDMLFMKDSCVRNWNAPMFIFWFAILRKSMSVLENIVCCFLALLALHLLKHLSL